MSETKLTVGDDILQHLEFAIRRDAEKGGKGMRSTREVADRAGVKIEVARRVLRDLEGAGLVVSYNGYQSGIEWKATKDGQAIATLSPTPVSPPEPGG